MPLLHPVKRPDFVALNAPAIEIAHSFIMERGAAGPDLDHKPHDRIAVSVGHPFGGADRISFDKTINYLSAAGERKAVHRHIPLQSGI
jgi:hypothetical protein